MHRPLLSVEKLSIGYKTPFLKDISFSIFPADLICLMGVNGCGKSTLFKTLGSELAPLSGSISLNGKNIESYGLKEKSKLISFVYSEKNADEHLRVEDLLILARHPYSNFWGQLEKKDFEIIDEILSLMGIEKFRNKRLAELSDGEKQKAWIARAFVQDTPLVFLDEPTNFLDIPHRLEVMRLLRMMARLKNKAIVFSSHDWDCALSTASWLWLVHEEKLLQGLPEDFILNGKIEEVFSRENFLFDQERGVFKDTLPLTQRVYFSDETVSKKRLHWTLHALEKMGLICEKQPDSLPHVTIRETEWLVQTQKGIKHCLTLEDLLNTLGRF